MSDVLTSCIIPRRRQRRVGYYYFRSIKTVVGKTNIKKINIPLIVSLYCRREPSVFGRQPQERFSPFFKRDIWEMDEFRKLDLSLLHVIYVLCREM